MLPDTAKLYMAPIADGQSYEKRLHFIHNYLTNINDFCATG